ncbi:hypothetical protein [Micromonospora zhanjiangensis]
MLIARSAANQASSISPSFTSTCAVSRYARASGPAAGPEPVAPRACRASVSRSGSIPSTCGYWACR